MRRASFCSTSASKTASTNNGILQTDGYTGYQKVPCQAHALCWAHARRYFVEAIPPDLQEEDLLVSICKEAIERINELFAIDKGLAGLTKEEREEQRLQLEKEKLEAYFAWLQGIEPGVLPWNETIQQNCK